MARRSRAPQFPTFLALVAAAGIAFGEWLDLGGQ
jgi:hypothetical protein